MISWIYYRHPITEQVVKIHLDDTGRQLIYEKYEWERYTPPAITAVDMIGAKRG